MKKIVIFLVLLMLILFISQYFRDVLNSPLVGEVNLDPLQRNIDFNFDTLFSLGDSNNLEVVDGSLVLAKDTFNVYYESGYWDSPMFDTQNDYVMWDWVTGDADFAGMQENLIENGDISDVSCVSWGNLRLDLTQIL